MLADHSGRIGNLISRSYHLLEWNRLSLWLLLIFQDVLRVNGSQRLLI